MIDTEIVQRCGCGEDDCVEILGLEESIYACFTCGYAGVTPSGADNYEDEIHIGNLEAEVKRLREENKMLLHGINDAISMSSSGAKTPVADGSIKHYFPLYLLEMIE